MRNSEFRFSTNLKFSLQIQATELRHNYLRARHHKSERKMQSKMKTKEKQKCPFNAKKETAISTLKARNLNKHVTLGVFADRDAQKRLHTF